VKFDTARKACTAYNGVFEASPHGGGSVTLAQENKSYTLTHSPTWFPWYRSFMLGMSVRMGQVTKQDRAFSIELVLEMMSRFEGEFLEAGAGMDLLRLQAAVWLVTSHTGSLRGFETTKALLHTLRRRLDEASERGVQDHYELPLLGRFKAQKGECCFVIPIAAETASGLCPLQWTKRLILAWEQRGHRHGWLFRTSDNRQRKMATLGPVIFEMLRDIQLTRPDLIPASVNVDEDFGLARSARRGSTTHARNQGVGKDDIDIQNRWRSGAQGQRVRGSMMDVYTAFELAAPTLLCFSRAL